MQSYRNHDFQNWYATCGRKRKFVAWLQAYNTAKREGKLLKVYKCPYCQNYHLTAQFNEDRKQMQSPRRIG